MGMDADLPTGVLGLVVRLGFGRLNGKPHHQDKDLSGQFGRNS